MKIKIGPDIQLEVSSELIQKINRIRTTLMEVKKVELEYGKYFIRFWMVDHGNGKLVLNIQIEEAT